MGYLLQHWRLVSKNALNSAVQGMHEEFYENMLTHVHSIQQRKWGGVASRLVCSFCLLHSLLITLGCVRKPVGCHFCVEVTMTWRWMCFSPPSYPKRWILNLNCFLLACTLTFAFCALEENFLCVFFVFREYETNSIPYHVTAFPCSHTDIHLQ